LILLACSCPALSAWAQEPSPEALETTAGVPQSENDKKAFELFRQGRQANAKGDIQGAYTHYKAAWQFKKSLDIATNLGVAEYNLSLANKNSTSYMRAAAEHLLFASKTFPFLDPAAGPGQPDRHRELRKQQAAVEGLLTEARKQVGTVLLTVGDKDCQVFDQEFNKDTLLSERASPYEKIEVFVEPGKRTLVVKRPGFKPTQKVIEVKAGSAQDLEVEVPTVSAEETRAIKPVVPPPGGGADVVIDPALQKRRRTILIGGMAAAGAGIFVGTVTAIVSSAKQKAADAKHDEIQKDGGLQACASAAFRSQCDELSSLRGSHDTLANAAIWSFVSASLVAGGTAAYYMLSAPPPRSASSPKGNWKMPSLGFAVTPQGGGVVVSDTF
jgi:hypothetical protein